MINMKRRIEQLVETMEEMSGNKASSEI